MACGCGKKERMASGYVAPNWTDAEVNERNMVTMAGDSLDCTPYRGRYRSEALYIVGQGTDLEKAFTRREKVTAIAYSQEHGLPISRPIRVKTMCEARVLALMGE